MKYLLLLAIFFSLGVTKPAVWTMVVVAGSNKQHVFDNARVAVVKEFQSHARSVAQLTVDPKLAKNGVAYSSIANLEKALSKSNGKCFLFMTSHGTEDGFKMGSEFLTPAALDEMLTKYCSGPTVVIVSACYSGKFAYGPMQKANRTILTASAPDRSSFGCSNDYQYTFWDQCFLNNVLGAQRWSTVYDRTTSCVEAMERDLKVTPSRPLMFEGKNTSDLVFP